MKGVFIHNQLEYRVEVRADDFCQGDSLPCVVSVKNHGSSSQTLSKLRLDLALGDIIKVRDKKEAAFTILCSAECPAPNGIAAGECKSVEWTFKLDENCPISDKSQSLYLLYGSGDADGALGQLPISVRPQRYIQQILGIFESFFQFVLKGCKSADGWVKAKLKPSNARRLSYVEELVLGFRFEDQTLVLRYVFRVKRLQTSGLAVGVKKVKTTVEQRLEPGTYTLTAQHVDHEVIKTKIEEALSTVAIEL